MKKIIEIKNVDKIFGDLYALKNINLQVDEGEFVAIIGPSGSGKTTLLNILSLMDDQTNGEYLLLGKDAKALDNEAKIKLRREEIGLIFQQFHLIPYLNVLENIMLAQYYHSSCDAADAAQLAKQVGLGDRLKHLPSQLSGGEQQRVCIARALINNPHILLADEPTGNLDEENEKKVLELFMGLKKTGKSIVLITHNLELTKFVDRTLVLHHGQMQSKA